MNDDELQELDKLLKAADEQEQQSRKSTWSRRGFVRALAAAAMATSALLATDANGSVCTLVNTGSCSGNNLCNPSNTCSAGTSNTCKPNECVQQNTCGTGVKNTCTSGNICDQNNTCDVNACAPKNTCQKINSCQTVNNCNPSSGDTACPYGNVCNQDTFAGIQKFDKSNVFPG